MMDLNYKGLRGEDLVNAYTADILEVEQRLGSVREKNCNILQERLQLLRRKTMLPVGQTGRAVPTSSKRAELVRELFRLCDADGDGLLSLMEMNLRGRIRL